MRLVWKSDGGDYDNRQSLRPSPREAAPSAFVEADELQIALDGQQLRLSGREWRVEVYGVCDQGERRWIQLALDGGIHYMLTIQLAAGDGVQRAVLALATWLARPSECQNVYSVA